MSLDPAESSSPRSSRAGSGPTPVWPAKNRDQPTRTRRSRTQPESSPASRGAPMQADRRRQDIWSGARLYPVSATGSCASLLAEQFSAQPAGGDIDNEDSDDDGDENRTDVGVIELADRDNELLSDTAGANKTHHRGLADIDLKAQQRVAGIAGRDLRQHRKAHAGEPACTGRAHTLDRFHVGVLDDLGEQLSERPCGMHGDCQYARHRPETEGYDENQREYDAGNGACEFEETPDDEPQPRRGRRVLRGEEIQHEGKHRAGQGADIADENGLAEHLEPLLPAPEPFTEIGPYPRAIFQGKNAVEIADEVAEIAEERTQIHFRADRCDNQRGEENYRRQSHLQTLARDRLAIGIVEHRKLLVWKDGYGIRHRNHCAQALNRTGVEQNRC